MSDAAAGFRPPLSPAGFTRTSVVWWAGLLLGILNMAMLAGLILIETYTDEERLDQTCRDFQAIRGGLAVQICDDFEVWRGTDAKGTFDMTPDGKLAKKALEAICATMPGAIEIAVLGSHTPVVRPTGVVASSGSLGDWPKLWGSGHTELPPRWSELGIRVYQGRYATSSGLHRVFVLEAPLQPSKPSGFQFGLHAAFQGDAPPSPGQVFAAKTWRIVWAVVAFGSLLVFWLVWHSTRRAPSGAPRVRGSPGLN